jgi:hypothetical protein
MQVPTFLRATNKPLNSWPIEASNASIANEASQALQQFLTEQAIDYRLALPHVHRRNSAERTIRTFKNHFIANLSGADPDVSLHLWDCLLPQALLTLNLLRASIPVCPRRHSSMGRSTLTVRPSLPPALVL